MFENAERRLGSEGLWDRDMTGAAKGSVSERVNRDCRRALAGSLWLSVGVRGSIESARERDEDTDLDGGLVE